MKLLLVVATRAEIAPLLDYYHLDGEHFIQSQKFDVLITGVGIAATAFALGQHLNLAYHAVLNVGIAGSFDREISLGDLVNVSTDSFAELGAESGDDFIAIDELGFGKSNYTLAGGWIPDLPQVRAITVNTVHGSSSTIERILERLNPQIESMEGAAICYASEQLNIPALQIRSISNYVEHRNTAKWEIGLAIQSLNNWLINNLSLFLVK